jgi:hypothetical protein
MRLDLLPVSPVVHWALRSLAGQLLVDALLIEAHDPAAADLDHRHPRLPRLANDVPRCIRVALYVDLLERNPALFEVALRPTTPGARGCAEQ